MTDETQAVASVETMTAKPSRVAIAARDWVNAAGESHVDDVGIPEETAVAVRYTLKSAELFGAHNGKSFTHELGKPGKRANMLEGFGALTLIGNNINTWKGLDERPENPLDMVQDRWNLLESGVWIDRSSTAGTPKIDKVALLQAILDVFTAAGKTSDPTKIEEKLKDDPQFVKTVRQVPAIAAAYARIVGKTEKTVDDVLAAL